MGSGCGSVGRAVASHSRSPRFKSSHRQKIILKIVYCQLYWKDENKEKEAGNGPYFLKNNRDSAWRAITKFDRQLGRYEPSSPSTKELHG